jgi:Spy/CpxP family protein refolding chaperone
MTQLLTGALIVIAMLAGCVVALLNVAAAADVTPPLIAPQASDDDGRARGAPQALTRRRARAGAARSRTRPYQ